jgi:uncharacterized protein YjbI with pentapeptide repeats
MANKVHLRVIKRGTDAWNDWRKLNPQIVPDLTNADLVGVELCGANLSCADFTQASLSNADMSQSDLSQAVLFGAILVEVDFSHAILSKANLSGAELVGAKLCGAKLAGADLRQANLFMADLAETDLQGANLAGGDLTSSNLSGSNLLGANLQYACLVQTDLQKAVLTGCSVYGTSVWNVRLHEAVQLNLVITRDTEPAITVDNLEVAQFVYLLLNNEKIRDVIDTITSKVVLILGRFTPDRKAVLDAIRNELRKCNYSPVLFDFEKPSSRDFTETISTLAHMARFIIADLTSPRSIPQELQAIVPTLAVPVQPLLGNSEEEYGMFADLVRKYHWVLPVRRYQSPDELLTRFLDEVVTPAEAKGTELRRR